MDFILNILSYWDSALAVILVLGGLIFVHELGHFLANRALGIGVITFSLGMGPRLCGKKIGKTDYRLSLLPFGGFVAAVGEYGPEIEQLGFTKEQAISNRPPWHRLIMAFAGPFANLVLAWLIYFGIAFNSGLIIPLPEVGAILPDSAAEAAGILPGDLIFALDGNLIDEWNQVPAYVGQSGGKEIEVSLRRGTEDLTLRMTPTRQTRTNIFGETEEAWLIGIQAGDATRLEKQGLFQAAGSGLRQCWDMIDMTLTSLKKLVTGAVSADNVGGPILIGQLIGTQAKAGLLPLLMLAALISVNLGLLNLLPIPILDGGVILFSLIEMLVRRPVPETIQERSMQVGAALLIMLMIFATFNDVLRWFK